MKVVLLESLGISENRLKCLKELLEQDGHQFSYYERTSDINLQIEHAKDADILIIANMPLRSEVIRSCKKLKFIDVAFTGVDHVDLQACQEMNIAVSNASGYSTEAVAELTLGMMISLLRNIPRVEKRCRNQQTKEGLVGSELSGKTVGIIGTGHIGKRVAELCRVFGCNILGYRRNIDKNDGITYVSMEQLLKQSDIVTLHCPANSSTKGLINKNTLALMKKSAILINTARGSVVDTEALSEALKSHTIAAAGIDVFDMEPPIPCDNPLVSLENVLLTPHVAFATKESMELRAKIVYENIREWMNGTQINKII